MENSKWRWRIDDADTRFDTTNRGLPEKSYSVETHDVDETGASVWNGESNNFFNLMELAFAEEKTTNMRLMMTSMQTLSGLKSGNDLEKLYAFYKKYFFDEAQEYFPSNAFNADARIAYEMVNWLIMPELIRMIQTRLHSHWVIIMLRNNGG